MHGHTPKVAKKEFAFVATKTTICLMKIFNKRLSDYLAFCAPFLVLIGAMGVIRLALTLGGLPNTTVKWFSINAVLWIGVLYYAVRVHTTRFGAYKQLLVIYALLNLVEQAVVIVGIVMAIVTGTTNIFSTPEYSFGANPWVHLGAHLTIGLAAGTLMPWLIGSAVLAVTRRVSPSVREPAVHAG
jgi:hypothetical protein